MRRQLSRLRQRLLELAYWFRIYSLRHRAGMIVEWLEKPRNARFAKLSLRFLVVGTAGVLGFLSRDIAAALRAEFADPMSAVVGIAKGAIPRNLAPYLQNESSAIGYLVFLVLLAAILLIVAWILYLAIKNSRLLRLPDLGLRRPSLAVASMLAAEAESEEDYFAAGGAIEIGRHPFIYTDLTISGWDVSRLGNADLLIEHDLGMQATYDQTLIEDQPDPSGNNGKKFALIATPTDYIDSAERIALQVRSTSYFEISKYLRVLAGNPQLKSRLTSIHPEAHQIPNSLCLHYIVQLADGNILCSIRRPNTAYSSGMVSLSGEEQLAEVDVEAGPESAAVHWFRRAICEEVFPVRVDKEGGLQEAWNKVGEFVISTRILSILYEEDCANYALMGFARLNLDLYWFKVRYDALRRSNLAGRDKEGTLCVMPKSELIRYCDSGSCKLFPIWGDKEIQVADDEGAYQMHPTSRYRALMLALASGAISGSRTHRRQRRQFDYSKASILESRIRELEAELAGSREPDRG
jgi:hypothetical protein